MKCFINKLSESIEAVPEDGYTYKEKYFKGAVNTGVNYEDIVLTEGQRIVIDVQRPEEFTSGQVAFYASNNAANIAYAENYNNESDELIVTEASNGSYLRARLNNYSGDGELEFIFRIKIYES